jgi:hypothetical protein
MNKPSNQLGKICGSFVPQKISSSLDHVYIHFAIGKYIHRSIFRLEWIVSGTQLFKSTSINSYLF